MKKLKKLDYKGYRLYYFDEYYSEIGKKILDNDFIELKKIKNTKRNYVSLIEVDKVKFIYKEPRNEFRIPQRQIMSFFKNGEALNTLINVNKLIFELNIKEYVQPFLAIVKRRKNFIIFSAILFEYVEERRELNNLELDSLIKKMQEIHRLGYYHGDFNPTNFLVDKDDNIRILDTQAKKIGLTNYRAYYDMLTMQENYLEMKYPYKKNFSYYFALSVKKFKRLKWVSWIKKKKKELRDKGWKI
ncbi:LPS biosynthesis protein [Fusobacterium russii]|uniref:LPS biosynthesis protein n=1 Tax=Fusobacterium russii TaxID=854 RepID=UPI0003A0B815|nr:LPS biosynthesis protein [Fusobacterium russii]